MTTDEPMIKLIEEIRNCPALYLRQHHITQLYYLLAGYGHAYLDRDRASRINEPLFQFGRYIDDFYAESIAMGWHEILLSTAGSETAAYDLFWQHWDAFMTEQSQLNDDQ